MLIPIGRAAVVAASLVQVATTGCAWSDTQAATQPPDLQIVIVVDGLRPDQVTAEQMPRLHRIAGRGVRFTAHHSVFPTVTRVNAATFVTGVLPARHGLLGNSIYIPSVDSAKAIDTADHEALLKVAAADGQLLTAPTIGQLLERAGKQFLVVSSGSSGSALLLSLRTFISISSDLAVREWPSFVASRYASSAATAERHP